MGGGKQGPYSNFMNKKSFHPNSYWNQRRVWKAEEKARRDGERQKELDAERTKEQQLADVRTYALMSRADNKAEYARRSVNFMYEPPPGFQMREWRRAGGGGLGGWDGRPRQAGGHRESVHVLWCRHSVRAGCEGKRGRGKRGEDALSTAPLRSQLTTHAMPLLFPSWRHGGEKGRRQGADARGAAQAAAQRAHWRPQGRATRGVR